MEFGGFKRLMTNEGIDSRSQRGGYILPGNCTKVAAVVSAGVTSSTGCDRAPLENQRDRNKTP